MPATDASLEKINSDFELITKNKLHQFIAVFKRDMSKESPEKLKLNYPKIKKVSDLAQSIYNRCDEAIQLLKDEIASRNPLLNDSKTGNATQDAINAGLQLQTKKTDAKQNEQIKKLISFQPVLVEMLESTWGAQFDQRCPGVRSNASVTQRGTVFSSATASTGKPNTATAPIKANAPTMNSGK